MAVRNRDAYASYSGGRGRRRSLFGGLLVMLLLGLVSFALGFFGLSPLLGQLSRGGATGNSAPSSDSAPGIGIAGASQGAAAPRAAESPSTSPPAPRPSSEPPSTNPALSPTIEPVEETRPTDGSHLQTPSEPNRIAPRADNMESRNARRGVEPSTVEPEIPRNEVNLSRPGETPEGVQQPARPYSAEDGNNIAPPTPSNTGANSESAASESAPRSENRSEGDLHRVQIGVFSTPERAEEAARPLREKSLNVSVRRYTARDGRTLYRVQHGIFRNRENADKAVQTLREAGIPAEIVRVR